MRPLRILVAACALSSCMAAQDPELPADRARELIAEGSELALAHDWTAALQALEQAVATAPDDADALRWRGHAYTGAGRYPEAFADLDRAVTLDDRNAWTHYARAMALHHLGRLPEAIEGYTEALARDPTFFKAHEWRGFTYSQLGDHVRALADVDVVLAVDRGNPWLRFIRAKAYVALADLPKAEQDFWLVVDADGANADAHAQLGYLYACTGRDDTAIRMLNRAAELDAPAQLETRAWVYQLSADAGDSAAADAALAGLGTGGTPDRTSPWTAQIASFLRGERDESELLAAARSADLAADEQRGRLCEAWLHIGLVRGRRGSDRDRAVLALANAVATDARDKWEWSWALRALRDLCGADAQPSPPAAGDGPPLDATRGHAPAPR